MKRPSTTRVTILLTATLLAGAGICVGLRSSADRERAAHASSTLRPSTTFTVDSQNLRAEINSPGKGATRVSDRQALRERLRKTLNDGNEMDRSRSLLEMIDGLNPADFSIFFDEVVAITEDDRKTLDLLFTAWAELDPIAAWQRESAMMDYRYGPSLVLQTWAERNPLHALAWLGSHGESGKPIDEVLRVMAGNDPAAAMDWAKEHSETEVIEGQRHRRLTAALLGMFPNHMDEAIRGIASLPEEIRLGLLPVISVQAGNLDQSARRQWLEAFPEGEERDRAVAGIIDGMKDTSPIADRLALLTEYPGAAQQPQAASLYKEWMQTDQPAAMAALASLPAGRSRDFAVRVSIEGLVENGHPREAMELMNRNPQVVDENVITSWFGMAATNAHEWEFAISQLPRVDNALFRERAYRNIMESWLFTDRNGARAWLDSRDDIPESVRKALESR